MNRLKMALFPCVLATITLLAALLLGTDGVEAAVKVVSQTSSGCGTWNLVSSPNIAGGDTTFGGIAAASTNDVWAVGNSDNAVSSIQRTLVEHWNGTKWSIVPSPNPGSSSNNLFGVTVVKSGDAWAVGYSRNGSEAFQTLIEHWNGSNWSVVSSPNPGSSNNLLYAVTAVSANDAWAVGDIEGTHPSQTLIEQWNGTSWNIVSSPNSGTLDNTLYSVASSSANNAWAVGQIFLSNGTTRNLIEHWNGSSWSIAASPNPGTGAGNDILGGVTVASNSFWAAGLYDTGGNSKALTEQFC